MNEDKKLHQLFNEIKEGNNGAIEIIYKEYKGIVYKIAFSVLKNHDDAEDIVQNVMCKIIRIDKDKLPTKSELSWLYLVTKNESINLYKSKEKNSNIDNIYEIKEKENTIDRLEDAVYYNQMIKKLTPLDQEIVSLKIISNFSFTMISKILDLPIGTVEWRYYKSVKNLKKSVIPSIILALSITKLCMNYNEIYSKNIELNCLISEKEKEENKDDENQILIDNRNKNTIKNKDEKTKNVEKYETMINDVNEVLQKKQNSNILISIVIIVCLIFLLIVTLRHRSRKKGLRSYIQKINI